MNTGTQKSQLPYRLMAPGPVPVPAAVLQAMSEKVLHHRTPQFMRTLEAVWANLQSVFGTQQPVQILTGSGSAGMEAAVANTLSAGDEALVVVSGKFGERWADICERHSVQTRRWNVPWGEALDLAQFTAQLKKYPGAKVVFTQGCETSTATLHPIKEMAALTHKNNPGALFAVDAITAVGCMPLPMDEWDIDVMIGGSQKAFMIPTGLSFIAMSERAWKAQSASKISKYYFDLAAEKKANAKGDSQFSIPTPLVVGLGMVLEQWRKKGADRVWKRCQLLAECTRQYGAHLGLKIYSAAPAPSVTAMLTPTDSGKIRDWLESERNITIMGGQDQLKGKILRVGHMGDVRDDDMVALFSALAEVLGKPDSFTTELARQLRGVEALFA